jgi:hypothetical protein
MLSVAEQLISGTPLTECGTKTLLALLQGELLSTQADNHQLGRPTDLR